MGGNTVEETVAISTKTGIPVVFLVGMLVATPTELYLSART